MFCVVPMSCQFSQLVIYYRCSILYNSLTLFLKLQIIVRQNNTDICLCCKGFFIYFRCVESRRFLLRHDVTVSLPYPPDSRLQRYSSFVNASVCASLFHFPEGSLFLTHVSGPLPILHLCDTTRQHLSKSHF